jgi:hypothetical protein
MADAPDSKSGGTDRALQCREGGDRDRLGVKSGDEWLAVGPGVAVLIPPGGAAPGGAAYDDPEHRGAAVRPGRRVVRLSTLLRVRQGVDSA